MVTDQLKSFLEIGGDVTDSVYTHKNLRQLRKAIMRIR